MMRPQFHKVHQRGAVQRFYLPIWEALLCSAALALRAVFVHGALSLPHLIASFLMVVVIVGLRRATGPWHVALASLTVGATAWIQGASFFSALAWVFFGALLIGFSRQVGLPSFLKRREAGAETCRRIFLLGTVLWTSRLFLTRDALGAGDSVWYTTMLKDFLLQLRAGIFPVWTGQTELAFNGAIFPLRIAPAFQHLGGLLDLITGHTLTALQIKNLLIVLTFAGAATLSYECLLRLAPVARTRAAFLSGLWLFTPGFLAPLYSGDQYMTFLTFPLFPVMLLGWLRWQQSRRESALLLLAVSLGGMWWCHTPVAIWTTLFTAVFLTVITAWGNRWLGDLKSYALLLGLGLVLGAYPILSIAIIDNKLPGAGTADVVVSELRRYFAANHLPLHAGSQGLGAYQIGYAVFVLVMLSIVYGLRSPRRQLAGLGILVLMLGFCLPVPGVTSALWQALPDIIIQVSNVWPQQRFFPLVTALAIVLFHVTRPMSGRSKTRGWSTALGAALLLGWSAWQADSYHQFLSRTRVPSATAELSYAPENALLTRYSYASFKTAPSYFSHGYVDPVLEHRLLNPETGAVLVSNAEAVAPLPLEGQDARLIAEGVLTAHVDRVEQGFSFLPALRLDPAAHYALRLRLPANVKGTLIVNSSTLNRDYLLPDSGVGMNRAHPSAAFGTLPSSSPILSLRTQPDNPIDVSFTLFFEVPSRPPLIGYWLYRVDPHHLPIQVESFAPYRMKVDFGAASVLETPRVWYRGWKAAVDGVPVEPVATAENLVGIPLKAGAHEIELSYQPPAWLTAWYWVSLIAWPSALYAGLRRLVRHG